MYISSHRRMSVQYKIFEGGREKREGRKTT
jgi:hypothetical protein